MNGEPIILNDHIEIFPASPLSMLDSAAGPAFAARDKNNDLVEHYALLCRNKLPIRAESIPAISSLISPGIVRFVDWGIVDWPDGARYPVLVFSKPIGQILIADGDAPRKPMNEDEIAQRVVAPVIDVLREFSGLGIGHGAIHPGNIFVTLDRSAPAQLGECLSTPGSYAMPNLFLTVERGMAKPAARGKPILADDFYALGMTVLALLIGRNPAKDMDENTVLQTKIDNGTLGGFMPQTRMRSDMVELLHGLLTDNPKKRWGLEEVDDWLAGHKQHIKPGETEGRPGRPFVFMDKEYWTPRAIAAAIVGNAQAAFPLIETGEIQRWIGRTFSNPIMANEIEQTNATYKHVLKSEADFPQLLTRIAIVLDPPAAIRYKGLGLMPGGVGPLLAELMQQGASLQSLAELISGQVFTFWVNYQTENRAEHLATLQVLEKCRTHITRGQTGYGIERVLYELNRVFPCLSPLILPYAAYTITEVLSTLEKIAKTPDRPRNPIDRHIAAFLAAHDARLTDKILTLLHTNDQDNLLMLGVLTVLSEVQYRHGPAQLPNLLAWLAGAMEPAILRFHNRQTQERIRSGIKTISGGSLSALLQLVDDSQALEKDHREFFLARQTHQICQQQIIHLRREIEDKNVIVRKVGQPIAVAVCVLISFVALLGLIAYSALGNI